MTADQQTAYVLSIIVLGLPGVLCVLMSRRNLRLGEGFIFGLATTFGVFGIWAVINRVIAIPYNSVTIVLLFLVSILIAGATGRSQRTQGARPMKTPMEAWLVTTFSVISLVWSWSRGTLDRVVIGNHDASIHSAFVGNIVALGSLDPGSTHSHPISGAGTTNFYPLAFHSVAAGISKFFGLPPSQVVYSLTVVAATVFLPIGTYLLAANIPGGSRKLGALASACLLPLYLFPQGTLGWGGISMVYGVVLLVSFLGLALWSLSRSTLMFASLCSLCVIVLATVHSSEVFLFFPLLLILGWQQLGHRSTRWLRLLVTGAAIFSIFYPLIERQLGFALISSLADVNPNEAGTLYQAVGQILLLSPGLENYTFWSLVFVFGGLVAIAYSRRMTQVVGVYAFLFLYAVIASQATKPWYRDVSHVLSPWYRQYQRLTYFLVPVVAILGGFLIDAVVERLTGPLSRRKKLRTTSRALLSLSFATAITFTSIGLTSSIQTLLFSSHSMHSIETIKPPFSELGVTQQDTLLASFDSGAGYWSIDHRMRVTGAPFMGTYLIPSHELLLDAIASFASRKDVRDAYSSLSIDYIVTNTRAMSGPPRPSASDLKYSNSFDSVWNVGGYQIWKARETLVDVTGPLTGWVTAPNGQPARWMTDSQVSLSVFNSEPREKAVRVKLRIRQNACKSGSAVRLGSEEYVVKSLKHLSLNLRIPPQTQVNIPISAIGEPCIDPSTGALVYLGVAPISTSDN